MYIGKTKSKIKIKDQGSRIKDQAQARGSKSILLLILILILFLTHMNTNATRTYFDHEKLIAYQRSVQFVAWSSPLLEKLPARLAVADQLDRASTSIPLNVAEGNAKYTVPDRCRYFDTARGSALECAACLDVLVAKGKCNFSEIEPGKEYYAKLFRCWSVS